MQIIKLITSALTYLIAILVIVLATSIQNYLVTLVAVCVAIHSIINGAEAYYKMRDNKTN